MGIVAESLGQWKAPTRGRCPWKRLYDDELDDADRKVIDDWLAKRVSLTAIGIRLHELGFSLNPDSIPRHYSGRCSCRG